MSDWSDMMAERQHLYKVTQERNTLLVIGVSVGRDLITPEIKARYLRLKEEVVPTLMARLKEKQK